LAIPNHRVSSLWYIRIPYDKTFIDVATVSWNGAVELTLSGRAESTSQQHTATPTGSTAPNSEKKKAPQDTGKTPLEEYLQHRVYNETS